MAKQQLLASGALQAPGTHVTGHAQTQALKPRLPEPDTFEGPTGTHVEQIQQICAWVDASQAAAALSGTSEAQHVAWVVTFLRKSSAQWYATHRVTQAVTTFAQLKDGLTHHYVGPVAFEILCAELGSRTLKAFARYETFRSWFTQTVTATVTARPRLRPTGGCGRVMF